MYQDSPQLVGVRIDRTNAPGCGTETEVSVATRSGREAAERPRHRGAPVVTDQVHRPVPTAATSAATSPTSRLIRYDERPRGRAPRE